MSRNDGHQMQCWPQGQPAGQDKKYFALGSCKAKPAKGYWASRAGLKTDWEVEEPIVGITDSSEIQKTLWKLFGYEFACDYMTYFKMGWDYNLDLN